MPSPSTNGGRDVLADRQTQLSAERQKLLAQRLKGFAKAPVEAPAILKRPDAQRAPLSFAQRQMWIIDQLNPGNPAYHIPVAYRLRGELDVQALEAAFNRIIERHEIWRTTFREFGDDAIQEIHPECKLQIEVIDLTRLPKDEREARARTLASEQSAKPFDLRNLPLIRVSLFCLEQNDAVLLINFHHIVGDGLSLSIVFDELDAFYRSAISGTATPLPALSVQYGDFSAWQKESISNDRNSTQLDFWKRELIGSLPVLELPADQPRPLRQSFDGSTIDFPISRALVEALTSVGRKENCTLFVTILAAFQIILARYSNAEKVMIGTPVADRPLREVDRLIGNFINMIALQCDLSGNPMFIELLRRSRATTLNALSNKDVPFEMVVNALKPTRDPGRNPIFQALLQILPPVRAKIGDLSVSSFDFEQRSAQVDLTLHLYEQPTGEFLGRFQYCTASFAEETIQRLSSNFCHLLDEIARDPLQSIFEIPILSEGERSRLLLEWNRTEVDYPPNATIHALFEKQAASTPDSIAVEFEGQNLTFRELDVRANQLSNRLRSLAVEPNVLVGISVERSVELVIGLLGILKAGGAYVPIDPGYPHERRAFMMEDAAVTVLLTQQSLVAGLPPHSAKVICLDTDWPSVAQESEQAPPNPGGAGDLAYMIYTSGSTGRPKGALNLHRGIVNRLLWMQDRYQITPSDCVLQKTPFSFDVSVWEFFWPLLTGARLVVAQPGGHQDPAYLVRLIQDRKITVIHFVPSMLRMFLDDPGVSACTSLRHVICSGEALPHDLQERFFARLPCHLHNLYGPTEAAVDVTHWTCQRDCESTVVPIGRPVANTQCYILDPLLQPVPIGASGELHLGGVQVGSGYHHRPELTAEKFIADPFCHESGARLYKTGDLSRYRADGVIEYLGRLDHQVKLRGFRIELGEIEELLRQDDEVREAAVVLREDAGEKRLAAYCVAKSQTATASGEERQRIIAKLSSSLRAKLPEYMLPSIFVFLDRLPVSANGKLDARALPAPDWQTQSSAQEYVAPRNATEETVASAWREILKLDRVGVTQNFFAVGGHSLLAIRLLSRLREVFRTPIPIRALFDAPTVEGLAAFIDRHAIARPSPGVSSLVAIRRGNEHRRPLFLVPGGWGGEIEFLAYGTLNSHLESDQPLYGLRARGADGLEKPHESVQEMAETYVSEIRTVQATGPYIIAGECIGGLLAYEMARILESQGQRVDPLILLDTGPPSKANAREFRAKERSDKWQTFLEVQVRQPAKGHWLKLSRLTFGQKLSYIASRIFRRRRPLAENSSPLDERKLLSHYPPMLMDHALKPYGGRVTLILSEKIHAEENLLGWHQAPVGGLDIHVIPGDHHSYIREHAASAAAKLHELIHRSTPIS